MSASPAYYPSFVSYSTADRAFCERFVAALQQRHVDVWYAGQAMRNEGTISQAIGPQLIERPAFIVLLSRAALNSTCVFSEFDVAFYLKVFDERVTRVLIPVFLEPLELRDFTKGWPFLLPYQHVAGSYQTPLPFDDAVQGTLRLLTKLTTSGASGSFGGPGAHGALGPSGMSGTTGTPQSASGGLRLIEPLPSAGRAPDPEEVLPPLASAPADAPGTSITLPGGEAPAEREDSAQPIPLEAPHPLPADNRPAAADVLGEAPAPTERLAATDAAPALLEGRSTPQGEQRHTAGAPARRMPVYLLLDTSLSMDGSPIVAVNNGVRTLFNELIGHSAVRSTVQVSLITFAHQIAFAPLTPLTHFIPPIVTAHNLQGSGGTALGGALAVVRDELTRLAPDERAFLFVLTDGEPTDGALWSVVAQEIKYGLASRVAMCVGIACGPDADLDVLQQICLDQWPPTHQQVNRVIAARDFTSQAIRDFFHLAADLVLGAVRSLPAPTAEGTDGDEGDEQ